MYHHDELSHAAMWHKTSKFSNTNLGLLVDSRPDECLTIFFIIKIPQNTGWAKKYLLSFEKFNQFLCCAFIYCFIPINGFILMPETSKTASPQDSYAFSMCLGEYHFPGCHYKDLIKSNNFQGKTTF